MIVPSRTWEAFGVVVVESLAAGRPVIASQLPGLADLIQPGQTGLLVPPESPQNLAHAIMEVALDPQRADAWGRAARRFVQPFDWRNIAQRHLDLFGELIAAKRSRAAEPLTSHPSYGHLPELASEPEPHCAPRPPRRRAG